MMRRELIIPLLILLTMACSVFAQAPQQQSTKSTAAAPTYAEGTFNPLSTDLSGNLRTSGGGGGGGGTSSNFGAASPATGTAAGARDTNGNMQPLQLDGAGTGQNLDVNCKVAVGCGTSSTVGAAIPSTGTLVGVRDTNGNMQPLQLDGAGTGQNLDVNCKTGCSPVVASAGDTVGSSQSLGAANNTAAVALAGENGAVVLFSGAAADLLTAVAEVSPDGGVTWNTAVFLDPVSGAMSTSLVNPANGQYQLAWFGAESDARVRVSAYTSGSINAQLRATFTRPWTLIGGSDGTNLRILSTDTSGRANVTIADGLNVTFGAKADAKSTATDTTAITAMQVLKEISFMAQNPAALPANQSINYAQMAGSTVVADPCKVNAKVYTPVSVTANTQLITGTSAKKIYICAINIVVAAATNVAIISGTGSVCATNSVGNISGGTTAATGWNFAANSGIATGNGDSTLSATTVNADNLCILVSAANQTSGMITSVVQ